MRDVFYTILVVWVLWRIINAYNSYSANRHHTANKSNNQPPKEGDTSIKYAPPVNKKISDDEGEYVDYEEIK